MLVYPSIDKLLEKIDSKYSLVTLASKRARQLEDEELKVFEPLEEYKSLSPVGKALEEIASGDLTIEPDSLDSSIL